MYPRVASHFVLQTPVHVYFVIVKRPQGLHMIYTATMLSELGLHFLVVCTLTGVIQPFEHGLCAQTLGHDDIGFRASSNIDGDK